MGNQTPTFQGVSGAFQAVLGGLRSISGIPGDVAGVSCFRKIQGCFRGFQDSQEDSKMFDPLDLRCVLGILRIIKGVQ